MFFVFFIQDRSVFTNNTIHSPSIAVMHKYRRDTDIQRTLYIALRIVPDQLRILSP